MFLADLPFITLVMPVLNEERFVRETIQELLAQNYPKSSYEIIVADGGSTDRTREIVREISSRHSQVILIDNPERLPSSGRNVGFRNGRGDLFLVVDGHCLIATDKLLSNLAACFERSGADCLGRPQPFVIPEEPTFQRAIALARSSPLGHSSNSYIHANKEGWVSPVSVGCAYRRNVFEKIGYVDESFDACEDVEFNYRVEKAGFRSFFCPSIAIHYFPRETLYALGRQMMRYGEGRIKFMFKHPETANPDMLLPLLFLVGLIGGVVFAALSSFFLYLYLVALALYLCLLLCESVKKGKSNSALIFKIFIAFCTIHISIGVGMSLGFLRTSFASFLRAHKKIT